MYKTMLCYCLKGRKNAESKNTEVARTKNGTIMLLSKYLVCDSEKWTFLKKQEAREFEI